MDKVFITRKYISIERGARYYYEEAVFSSYEKAYEFVKLISEEDDDLFLSEIAAFPLNDTSPCDKQEVFTYDRKGNLIHEYYAIKKHEDCHVFEKDGQIIVYRNHAPNSYSGKFKVGDIVFIRAFPWNHNSPLSTDTIGIIAQVPISFNDWVSKGNNKYEWDNTYVINHIRNGFLDHFHIEEKGITLFNGELPNNLMFLYMLANHYLNKKQIAADTMEQIYYGNIFIENIKYYNGKNIKLTYED